MKNFMKLALPVGVVISLLSAQAAMAQDCKTLYSKELARVTQERKEHTQTLALVGASALVVPVLDAPVMTSAAGLSSSAMSGDAWRVSQVEKVLRLLTEAEIGDGILLRELADKHDVDPEVVANITLVANADGTFCKEPNRLLTYKEVTEKLAGK